MRPDEVKMKERYKKEVRAVSIFWVSYVLLLVAGCATQKDPVLQCAERGKHFVYRQGKCVEMNALPPNPKAGPTLDPSPVASPVKKIAKTTKGKSGHKTKHWKKGSRHKAKRAAYHSKHKSKKKHAKHSRKRRR